MTTPKDIPFPMTVDELQEKIRSGEFRAEAAETLFVSQYEEEVQKILVAVGRHMEADDEDSEANQEDAETWAYNCFVSDMSTISDFGLCANEIAKISFELGVSVTQQDYIYAIA